MSEAWKQWEGQVVDGRFPLREYLGGSDHSAVFLTARGEQEPQRAAIKLIAADPANADLQFSRWKSAAQLFHPHLLRLFEMGRCELENVALLYLVMEYANESLSQILPQRPLTPEETHDVLEPILDALACIHRQGFVHAHLKPSNILASSDKIKLSTDGLVRLNETLRVRKPTVYDPPEAASGKLSPVSDIWSLGVTLLETLTQHVPVWERMGHADPILPKSLPAPFLNIARNCLHRDPQLRCTVADISAKLRPSSAVPLAPASPAPEPRPQKIRVPSRPVAKAPKPPARQRSVAIPNFAVPLLAVVLALAAMITVPKLLSRRPEVQKAPPVASEKLTAQSKVQSKSDKMSAPSQSRQLATPSGQTAVKTASEKQPIKKTQAPASPVPPPAIASSEERQRTSTAALVPGEVLNEVLPDVSQKARDTIRGTVRVSVKVHVNPSGDLAGAELESPGPSKYFADQALQAARRWEFAPAKVDGSTVSTDWTVRFEFSQRDTKVFPVQTAPR